MKILWLSHFLPYPPKAGVLIRGHYMVKELTKYHEVDVLAFNQRALIEPYFKDYHDGTKAAIAELSKFCQLVEAVDCPTDASLSAKLWCAFKSLFTRHSYTVNWLASKTFRQRLNQLQAERNYDLIHFDTISLAPYIDGFSNKPVTSLDHHNVESHMLERRSGLERNFLKKLYFRLEANKVKNEEIQYCPQFDVNITCSELDNERFESFVQGSQFICVPNGVDIDRFRPSSKEPCANKVIFIGTLDWYPNTRAVNFIAEHIWPLLKKKAPDISIDIIGANPPRNLLELSQSDPAFKVHGYVDDLDEYLSQATIYVCPIDDGGGTKLKILDALSSGKAIVANPIACEGIACEHMKNVMFASKPEEYAEHIVKVLQSSDLRQKLEKEARILAVNNYSYASIGKSLSNTFIELVDSNKSKQL